MEVKYWIRKSNYDNKGREDYKIINIDNVYTKDPEALNAFLAQVSSTPHCSDLRLMPFIGGQHVGCLRRQGQVRKERSGAQQQVLSPQVVSLCWLAAWHCLLHPIVWMMCHSTHVHPSYRPFLLSGPRMPIEAEMKVSRACWLSVSIWTCSTSSPRGKWSGSPSAGLCIEHSSCGDSTWSLHSPAESQ
jgi:hypothetical protein